VIVTRWLIFEGKPVPCVCIPFQLSKKEIKELKAWWKRRCEEETE